MRGLTTAMTSALNAGVVNLILFVECSFTNEVVYMHSSLGTINFMGVNWIGVGTLGSVSTIEENSSVVATGTTLTLSGLDPQLLSDTMEYYQQGLPCLIYLGAIDGANALIPNPILSFQGRMDLPTILIDGPTATISINAESRLVDMNTSVVRRWTAADQALTYPTDQAFNFVNSITQAPLFWGEHSPTGQSSGTTSG